MPAGQVPPGVSVVTVVRNGSSYSFSHRLQGSVVDKFFNAQSIAPLEINRQVYGPNIMSKQMVRRLYRQCSEGRESVHYEEHSGQPSLINDHLLNSPDLASSDFHVFLHLKTFMSSGEYFGNEEQLKMSVTRLFQSQAAELYDRGIQKLIPQYDKCLNSGGGYF